MKVVWPKLRTLVASLASFFALALFALAGSLTPPGAPAPTMNTLAELYDSIVGGFDSSGVVADQNGSLIEHLKYIEANMPAGSGWTDDGTVVRLTTITDNVGIGTTTPNNRLQVADLISFDDGNGNTALGSGALSGNLGFFSTAVGYQSLRNNSGGNNTANGFWALLSNTTGSNNTAVGTQALYLNDTGNNNTAMGWLTLESNTTGSSNVANGSQALFFNTTGSNNTANGSGALLDNTTGSSNTGTGAGALAENNSGDFNTANGFKALYLNTGSNNTAMGADALQQFSAGSDNVAVGASAGYSYTGSGGVFIGRSAGNSTTTGANNTAVGYQSLFTNTTGSENTANGYQALFANTTGLGNTANGAYALNSNTVGVYNAADGAYALYSNTTGNDNSAQGSFALYANTTGVRNSAHGGSALTFNTTGRDNSAQGAFALANSITGSWNTAQGSGALSQSTGGEYNTAIGAHALNTLLTGSDNVAVGASAGYSYTGSEGVFIGRGAGYSTTTGVKNTAVGYQSLFSNTIGDTDAAFGYQALFSNTSGFYNTALGAYTLSSNTTGQYNTAIGATTLYSNTTGTVNTGTGVDALYSNTTGSNNTADGFGASSLNTTGSYNTPYGAFALYLNQTGSDNIAVGASAGYNALGSGNVFLGHNAGAAETGSNRLYIDNSSTANPLIYGEFDTNHLTFNGSASVSGNFDPAVTNTYDLGSAALRWRNLFANNASISSNLEVGNIASVSQLFINGTAFSPSSAGGWTDDGTVVRLTTITDSVGIGTVTPAGLLGLQQPSNTAHTLVANRFSDNSTASGSFLSLRGAGNQIVAQMDVKGGFTSNIASISPAIVGSVTSSTLMDGADAVYVSGRYAYMTALNADRFDVIDISNPASPSLRASITSTQLDGANGVTVSGHYAYVTALNDDRLLVIDIANPSAPIIVGSVQSVAFLDGPDGVRVAGRYAYVAASNVDRFTIVDVSIPSAPTIAGSVTSTQLDGASDVYIAGHYAYVTASNDDRLTVVDISNPSAPTIVGSVQDSANLDIINSVYVSGRYAYAAAQGASRLTVVDVANPASPAVVGSVLDTTLLTGANWVTVAGRYAYVTAQSAARMTIVDVSDPLIPRVVGSVRSTTNLGLPRTVFLSGRYAYVTGFGSDRLNVIDVTGFDIPTLLTGTIQTSTLETWDNADIGNNLLVRGGLTTGEGLLVGGNLSVTGSSSFFAGSASISGTLETGGMVVNGHILPGATDTYDLGSSTLRWRDLYLASGSLHIGVSGDEAVVDYDVASDYLAFKPDGTNTRMAVLDGGNVGIGTTTPASMLDINAGAASGIHIRNTDDDPFAFMISNETYSTDPDDGFGMWQQNNGSGVLQASTGTGATLVLTVGGRVGISDDSFSPDATLDVAGNILASTSGNVDLILRSSSATADDGLFRIRSAGASERLDFMNQSTMLMAISSTGFVGIADNVTFDPTSPTVLGVGRTFTDLVTAVQATGLGVGITLDPAAPPTFSRADAIVGEIYTDAANAEHFTGQLHGGHFLAEHDGSGIADYVQGSEHYVINGGSGTISSAEAGFFQVQNLVNGNITDARGIVIQPTFNPGVGTVGDNYGLFVIDQAGIGTGVNYNIFSTGAASQNVFEGSASISGELEVVGSGSFGANVYMTGLAASDATDQFVCRDPATGEITFGVTCTASSIRFKKNVEDLSHGLDWVRELRPVTFDWKHNGEPSLGFIAEEVNEVSPLLALRQDGKIYSVNYQIMTSVLAKAIQELDLKVETLAAEGPMEFDEQGMFERFVAALADIVLRVKGLTADEVRTDKICVGDTCVTEEQFQAVFGASASDPTPTPEVSHEPTPTPDPSATPEPSVEPTPTPDENGSSDEPLDTPTPEPSPETTPETP